HYDGKADFLLFKCAIIQLPSQTLLLSVSDKASRLIGMFFPALKVSIPSYRYCTEILASLPFTAPDEPLYLIYTINRVLQVRFVSLETTMKALSSRSVQEDKHAISDENGADCQETIALQLLLKLKIHLKIAFGLSDARCQECSPNDSLKPGEALSRQNIPFDISRVYISLPTSHKEIIERYQAFPTALRRAGARLSNNAARNVGPVSALLRKIGLGVHMQGKGKVRMVQTRCHMIRHVIEGILAIKTVEVRERIFGSLGYDVELPMKVCQLEGLDTWWSKELGSSVDEVFTSGRTNEFDSGGEGGLEKFSGFPGRQFRDCTVAEGEEYFFLLADLEVVKRDRGIDEWISLEYFDGDVWSDLSEGFLYYLSQLENGLSIPLTNLAKGVMNAIGACPVQMNENMWEVITVCDHLNDRWEKEKNVRRITPEDVLQFYEVKNFKASGGSYFCASVTRHHFFDLNLTGRTWNDNIVWVKGNCLQRGMKSTVKRKESLLDEVAEEETELEPVLGEPDMSIKKRVESKSKKIAKAQLTREKEEGRAFGGLGEKVAKGRSVSVDDLKEVEEKARLAILQGKEDTSQMVARLVKGIWRGIKEQESELEKANNELEKNLALAKTDALKEVKQLKATHAMVIGQLQVEAKANLDETAEECDRLGRHLMLKGYSQEKVDTIKSDTYAEEEEKEAEVLGVVDGLDGVYPQMVLDNQGDDVELPKGGSEKVVKEMSLKINDLEFGLARERKTSKALLSLQTELQALERTEELCRSDLNRYRIELEQIRQKFIGKDDELKEKVLEGEIRAKDLLVKRKDELLKDLPMREELNAELGILCARVVELQAINLAKNYKSQPQSCRDSVEPSCMLNQAYRCRPNKL
ncbi:hypothetical protein GIB67_037591, partial [Kingdonia uniflora]